jgi:AcrR family transcriptional regulator
MTMDDHPTRASSDPTRQRLLEAAELVFAETGFEAASVREICRRAEANVSAINYHFGDKRRLYIETVKYAHRLCHEGVPFPEWPPGTSAVQRLQDFIHVMVQRMLLDPHPASLQLITREMAQPTEACAEWVGEYIRPMADTLRSILSDLMPEASEQQRWLTGFSIVGQCLHYKQNRPVIQLLLGPDAYGQLDADIVAQHITAFTFRALGLRPPPTASGGRA